MLAESGAPADEAILRATSEQADVLAAVDDDYFRERAADVRDVGRRVAAILTGAARPDLWHADGTPAVLIGAGPGPVRRRYLAPGVGGRDRRWPVAHRPGMRPSSRGRSGIPLVLGLGAAVAALGAEPGAAGAGDRCRRGWDRRGGS